MLGILQSLREAPDEQPVVSAVSPLLELGAYESLWLQPQSSFKSIAGLFRDHPGSVPSDFVPLREAAERATEVLTTFRDRGIGSFGIRVHGAGEYPIRLRDAEHPIEVLYYRGNWALADEPRAVAIVGSRQPSEEGIRRARKLVRHFVRDGVAIVSGLAKGIDTIAHTTAIEEGGQTIAVVGTPISESYPKENAALQEVICRKFLLISQVPVLRYMRQDWRMNRLFFPERNVTMSALTAATVIVEAGETSGTLTQARAALAQGRKLFILDSNFKNRSITWPSAYLSRGAIRVADYEEIVTHLPPVGAEDAGER
jgi:DNA processing protein